MLPSPQAPYIYKYRNRSAQCISSSMFCHPRCPPQSSNFGGVRVKSKLGGGPRVVVSTAALNAGVRGSFPGLGGLKETKTFLPKPVSGAQYRYVSSHSSYHPQEVSPGPFEPVCAQKWPKA